MDQRLTVIRILLGLGTFASVYFFLLWLSEKRRIRRLSPIEIRNLQIQEEMIREKKQGFYERIQARLQRAGYHGDMAPFLVGIAFGYLAVSALLTILGFDSKIAVLVALPVSVGSTVSLLGVVERKRQNSATTQMLQVLRNVITYLEAGNTPQQAFNKAAILVGNPLRRDILDALGSQIGSVGMGTVMAPLRQKYDSPATRLLVSALEVNDLVGAKLAPTLRQAEEIVRRQIELGAEASAEVSQAKAEFIGISAVIGFIAITLILGAGEAARSAYTSVGGLTLIGFGTGNYALGIWRTLRVFRKAKRGVL